MTEEKKLFHGVLIPSHWENPKFVETVDGAFTMQIFVNYDKMFDLTPAKKKELSELDDFNLKVVSRQVLKNLTGQNEIPRYKDNIPVELGQVNIKRKEDSGA
jgi:hypothetical protein